MAAVKILFRATRSKDNYSSLIIDKRENTTSPVGRFNSKGTMLLSGNVPFIFPAALAYPLADHCNHAGNEICLVVDATHLVIYHGKLKRTWPAYVHYSPSKMVFPQYETVTMP